MLSIGTVSAGNAAQRAYHERQLVQARDDYYRETEGPAGTWVGSAAAAMGLAGEVTVEQFGRMLDGQHPGTGAALATTGSLDQRKTIAFDLAFSAPKSVSLIRMAAEPETAGAIDRAHGRAVLSALSYVEGEGWKGRQIRDGKRVATDGTGVVGVLYRHETTRNADPQLHSHAVLANLVNDGTGRIRAINSPILYAQAKTAGTVYQAVLRGELGRELGIEFDRPVNGLADIKGFDRELVDRFSTRRAEILEQLRAAGFTPGGAAAERVALESRRAKDMDLDHVVWRGEVREVLEHAGLGPEQAQAFTRSPAEREVGSVDERVASAPVGGSASQKATEDARPVRQAAMSVAEGYTADEVGEALKRVFRDERLVQVQEGEKPRWTTGRHLELEEQLRSDALARTQDTVGPRLPTGHAVPTQTPDGHALSSEQRGVLREILTSGRGVEVVRARAGAGKTTIAGLARQQFENEGYRVVGVAPTLQALAELDDVGLDKRDSLARTALGAGDYSPIMRTMDHRTVVILDEAAMAQTQQVAPLLRRAQERGAKVVAVGDDVQLQSVGAGGWFRYLAEHHDVPVLALTEVHRQRDEVERDRLNQLHRGDVAGWIRWADQADRITVAPTVADAYETTIDRYRAALTEVGGDVDRLVVMAPANQHREQLNERLRRVAVDQGVVDRDGEREFDGILVAPGDRLVARETYRPERERIVENGERFEVLTVGADGITARAVAGARRGQDVTLPADVFGPAKKDGRIVEHGYARTIHKAQGMTVDRSILFVPEPGRIGQNEGYVGLSRTRDRADLVTVADSRPQALERLARSLGERRDHEAAVAYLDRPALEPERLRAMGAPELDEHRHALLTETRQAMTKLTRLDREARGAWAASGDARGDAALVARRDQLEARIAERIAHLAAHDPDGDRQARPLMERTIRQGIDRDRAELERLDDQVIARSPIVTPADADARQHEIRTDRRRTAQYVKTLLQDLERVHGQQIDRTARPGVDPMTVPEHERPGLAVREAREHRDRVAGLNLAAAQQLGVGHPLVARWVVDRGAEVEDRVVRASRPGPLSVLQQRFHDALDRWWAVRQPWEAAGGRGRMDTLRALAGRLQTARTEYDGALAEQRSHLASTAPRRPRSAVEVWHGRTDVLARNVEHATTARDRLEHQRVAVERDGNGNAPIDRLLNREERGFETVRAARLAGREAERDLRAAGPAGVGPDRIERLLGRRDDLSLTDQRRYDELAGRVATQQALSRMPADGRVAAWVGASRDDVQPDVARWRHEHDLTLTPPQRQVVDRDAAHVRDAARTQERPPDRGPER